LAAGIGDRASATVIGDIVNTDEMGTSHTFRLIGFPC
jgi:hypothetical protein